METHWIVKGFDVLEHRYFGVIDILKALEFGPFVPSEAPPWVRLRDGSIGSFALGEPFGPNLGGFRGR